MDASKNNRVMLLVFMIAFGMRFWGIGEEQQLIWDEPLFVPAADNFISHGICKPNVWAHPPFTYFLTYASMKLFGNNPYGWRMMNVILGSLSVVVLVLLANELFGDHRISFLAALLMTIEPMHIMTSRTNFTEIAPVFLFLSGMVATVRYVKGNARSPVPAGICAGLSIACKWYYLPALAAVVLFVVLVKHRDKSLNRSTLAYILAVFILLPLTVYMATFFPWYTRGYSVLDFFQMQIDAYREMKIWTVEAFGSPFFRSSTSNPWKWFLTPIVHVAQYGQEGAFGRFFVFMNNIPVWLLTLPALILTLIHAGKEQHAHIPSVLVVVLFFATYAPLMLSPRPIFLYSAIPILPFAYLSLARSVVSLSGNARQYRAVCIALILWGAYLFPFVTGMNVPVSLYAPLLKMGNVVQF